MRAIRVRVSPEFLLDGLGMPRWIQILDASKLDYSSDIQFVFEHTDFPEVLMGEEIPEAMPVFTRIQETILHPPRVEITDWGIENEL